MTFNNAAYAIDGARIPASLARLGQYATLGRRQGVVASTDLKVSPLDIPGVGFQISAGGGVVLNRYLADPTQSYVVENPAAHVVPASAMPGASASVRHYIVAIVIGDPEFSQIGHPFMGSEDPPAGEETTFEYVRPTLIQVADATVTDVPMTETSRFPALPLARLTIPANETTITESMFTDLRKLVRPERSLEIEMTSSASSSLVYLNSVQPTFIKFPGDVALPFEIPEWATTAKVIVHLEGVRQDASARLILRSRIEGTTKVTGATNAYEHGATSQRKNYTVPGQFDVSDIAGTTRNFILEAAAYAAADAGKYSYDWSTTVTMQVYFEEAAI